LVLELGPTAGIQTHQKAGQQPIDNEATCDKNNELQTSKNAKESKHY